MEIVPLQIPTIKKDVIYLSIFAVPSTTKKRRQHLWGAICSWKLQAEREDPFWKKDTLGQFLTSRQCLEHLENQNII